MTNSRSSLSRIAHVALVSASVLLAICAYSTKASGAPMRIYFEAVIYFVDDAFCLCLDVAVGDTIVGYYTYDTAAQDLVTSPQVGHYDYFTPPNGIVMYVNGYVIQTDVDSVDIHFVLGDSLVDGQGGDYDVYRVRSNINVTTMRVPGLNWIAIELRDNSATALSSDSLPLDAPNLDDWPDGNVLLIVGSDNEFAIWASLISASVTAPTAAPRSRPESSTALLHNAPNPFNPDTRIWFVLERGQPITLRIYDAAGRRVAALVEETLSRGLHSVRWTGVDSRGQSVGSGVYFAVLEAGQKRYTRKLVLLR